MALEECVKVTCQCGSEDVDISFGKAHCNACQNEALDPRIVPCEAAARTRGGFAIAGFDTD